MKRNRILAILAIILGFGSFGAVLATNNNVVEAEEAGANFQWSSGGTNSNNRQLPDATVGEVYDISFSYLGSNYDCYITLSDSDLEFSSPPGDLISTFNYQLHGLPSKAGDFVVTIDYVYMVDDEENDQTYYNLHIKNKINYDANAGTETVTNMPVDNNKYDVGDNVTLKSEIPFRYGYYFEGWTYAKDDTNIIDASTITMGSSSLTLYAKWLKVINDDKNSEYYLSVNSDVKTLVDSTSKTITYEYYEDGNLLPVNNTLYKSTSLYTVKVYFDGVEYASLTDITPFKVTFDPGKYGEKIDEYYLCGKSLTFKDSTITRTDGLTFGGYYFEDDDFKVGDKFTVTEDNTVIKYLWNHIDDGIIYNRELTSDYEGGYLYSGYYFLSEDLKLTYDIGTASTKPIRICLNGHILDLNNKSITIEKADFSITDCKHVERYLSKDGSNKYSLSNTATDLSVSTGIIMNGKSDTDGCIKLKANKKYNFSNLTFINNITDKDGGCIETSSNDASLTVIDCYFYGNIASAGGALKISSSATIKNCTFEDNTATNGGAIAATITGTADNIFVNIYDCNFAHNKSTSDGGALYSIIPTLVERCSFIENESGAKGGAIYTKGKFVLMDSIVTDNKAATCGGGIFVDGTTCIAEGTLVEMADGSLKEIENVKVGDSVKTLNHFTGDYDSNKVYYVHEGYNANSFSLNFEDGTELKIVGSHDLFNEEVMNYVTVDANNVDSFIGNYFYNAATSSFTKLVSVTFNTDNINYYSIYVEENYNVIANGMLTVCDDYDFLVKIYEYNNDLTINQEQLNKDIATYGYLNFEDASFIDLATYKRIHAEYYYIYIGKGFITEESLLDGYESYQKPLINKLNSSKTVVYHKCNEIISNYSALKTRYAVLGGEVTVTDNKSGNQADGYVNDNISLDNSQLIILDNTKIDAGINIKKTETGTISTGIYTNDTSKVNFTLDCDKLRLTKTKETNASTYTYEIKGYKVIYDTTGYTVEAPTDDSEYRLDDDVSLNTDELVCDGYFFFGWSLTEGGEPITELTVNTTDFVDGVCTLYPVYKTIDQEVQYEKYQENTYGFMIKNAPNGFNKFVVEYYYNDEWKDVIPAEKGAYDVRVTHEATDTTSAFEVTIEDGYVVYGYTVSYDENGATSGETPDTLYFYLDNQEFTVSDNTGNLKKIGHKFVGWSIDSAATTPMSFEENKYTTEDKDIVLYAVWEQLHTHGTYGNDDYIEFDQILDSSFTGGTLETGNYFMKEDITLTSSIEIGVDAIVRICMNGHILNLNGSNEISTLGSLYIYNDASTVHKFTVDANNNAVLDDSGSTIVKGGVITGFATTDKVKAIISRYSGDDGSYSNVNDNQVISIQGVTFIGNRSTITRSVSNSYTTSGLIYGYEVILKDVAFTFNTVSKDMDCGYVFDNGNFVTATILSLDNVFITDNIVNCSGEATYNDNPCALICAEDITSKDCIINRNKITCKGNMEGLIVVKNSLTSNNDKFKYNTITCEGSCSGGIYYINGDATFTDLDMANNSITLSNSEILSGALIFVFDNESTTEINDSYFTDNTVVTAGLIHGGLISTANTLNIVNVMFEGNKVTTTYSGSVDYAVQAGFINANTLYLEEIEFTENSLTSSDNKEIVGAFTYAKNITTEIVNYCDNTITGGSVLKGIFANKEEGSMDITSDYISGNTITTRTVNGGIYYVSSYLSMTSVTITDNEFDCKNGTTAAKLLGLILYAYDSSATALNIYGVDVENNNIDGYCYGLYGGLFNFNAYANVTCLTLENNTINLTSKDDSLYFYEIKGGLILASKGLYLSESSIGVLNGNSISAEKIRHFKGGAIYLASIDNDSYIENTNIAYNKFDITSQTYLYSYTVGMVLYCEGSDDYSFYMTDSSVLSNTGSIGSRYLQGSVYSDYCILENIIIHSNSGTDTNLNDSGTESFGLYMNDEAVFTSSIVIENNTINGKARNFTIQKNNGGEQIVGILNDDTLDANTSVGITYLNLKDTDTCEAVLGAAELFDNGYFHVDSNRFYLDKDDTNIYICGRITEQPAAINEYDFVVYEDEYPGTFTYQWYRIIDGEPVLLVNNTNHKLDLTKLVIGTYRCLATATNNSNVDFVITSADVKLKPGIIEQPDADNQYFVIPDLSRCEENNVKVSYEWYKQSGSARVIYPIEDTNIITDLTDYETDLTGSTQYDSDTCVWTTGDNEVAAFTFSIAKDETFIISQNSISSDEIIIIFTYDEDEGMIPIYYSSFCLYGTEENAGEYTLFVANYNTNDDTLVAGEFVVGYLDSYNYISSSKIHLYDEDELAELEYNCDPVVASGSGYTINKKGLISVSLSAGEFLYITYESDDMVDLTLKQGTNQIGSELSDGFAYFAEEATTLDLYFTGSEEFYAEINISTAGTQEKAIGQIYSDLRGNKKGNYFGKVIYDDGVETYSVNTALFEFDPYYVSYDYNGGTSSIADTTKYKENADTTVLDGTITKANYNFMGWSLNKDLSGTVYKAGDAINVGDGLTLYAIWEKKDDVVITTDPQTYTYNGQSQDYIIKGTNKDLGDFVVEYYENDAWTTTAPTNAGSYKVRITRAEDATYASYEETIDNGLVINKYTVTVTAVADNFTYNGQDQKTSLIATYQNINNQTVNLQIKEMMLGGFRIPATTFIDAYLYEVIFEFKTNEEFTNYIFEGNTTFVRYYFNMQKYEVTIDWENDNYTYTGSELIKPTASYKDVNNNVISLTVSMPESFKNYGEYTATVSLATLEEGTNYKLPTDVSKTYHIKKAKVAEPTIIGTYTYNGSEQTVSLSGVETYMSTTSVLTQVNAGSYTIVYTLDDNHEWAEGSDGQVTWSIGKATAAINTAPVVRNYTYNGSEQTVESGATLNHSETTLVYSNNKFTNAGTYTITISAAETANYKATSTTVDINVKKATATINTDSVIKTYTYNGSEQTIESGATLNHSETTLIYSNNKFTNAGTYTITISADSTDNYKATSTTVEITVNKMKVNEPTVAGNYVYNGYVKTVALYGLEDYMSTIDSELRASEVGDHLIHITLDDNHEWADGEDGIVTWTIKAEKLVPTDEETKNEVIVISDEGFDKNVTVVVEVVVETEVETKELTVDYYNIEDEQFKLEKNEKVGVIFSVKLFLVEGDSSTEITELTEGTTLRVKMKLPEGIDISKVTRILHVHSATDIEKIDFDPSKVDENGYYEIEITKLSEFAFIYERNAFPIWAIVLICLFVIFILLFIFWKHEFDKAVKNDTMDDRKLDRLDPLYRPLNKLLFGGKAALK